MESKFDNGQGMLPWLEGPIIVNILKHARPDADASRAELVSVRKVQAGYLSQTFRVVARCPGSDTDEPTETSLIVKCAPVEGSAFYDTVDGGVFTKEMLAYGSFLPAVEAALRAAEGDKWQPLGPKLYHQNSQPTNFMALEDLDASGFRKLPKAERLDLEHCCAALRIIARVHAASVALLGEEQYSGTVFRESLIFYRWLSDNLEQAQATFSKTLEVLSEYPWFSKYSDKMQTLDLVSRTLQVIKQCRVDFKVMLHGDFNKFNMMYRRNGDALQVCLYDFQGLHIGSPAEDLHYFLHMSAGLEVLQQHVDHLLCEYHSALQETLRGLGLHRQADAYPLQQLQRDMDHFGTLAVYAVFNFLPFTLKEGSKDCRRNEKYHQYVKHLLPIFEAKGFLEP